MRLPVAAARRSRTSEPSRAPATAPLLWSVVRDPPMSGAENMARDHALARSLREGEAALRIYGWAGPTISFGRNEPAVGRYDVGAATRRRLYFVRRPSGGRAVLHDRELTYAVAAPIRALGGARRAYMTVNAGLVGALRSLGVSAEFAPDGAAYAPDAGPCFQRAAAGEVVVSGRKLVGSAQVRLGDVLLQHGSLLLGPGQELMSELAGGGDAAADPPISLAELMRPVPAWDDLTNEVVQGLSQQLGGRWQNGLAPALDLQQYAELLERYSSDAWTWRR